MAMHGSITTKAICRLIVDLEPQIAHECSTESVDRDCNDVENGIFSEVEYTKLLTPTNLVLLVEKLMIEANIPREVLLSRSGIPKGEFDAFFDKRVPLKLEYLQLIVRLLRVPTMTTR